MPDGSRQNVDASRRTADAIAGREDLFSSSVSVSGVGRALSQSAGAIRVQAMRVDGGFTQVVGISPILGRTFTRDEELAGEAGGAALISHRLWQSAFGGDRGIAGRTMHLDGRAAVIVGVLPLNFHVPYDTDVWFPSRFSENERGIFLLARLASGVTLDQARLALEPMGPELNQRYPDVLRGLGVTAVSAHDYFVDDQDRVALMLMGAVGMLLLIGCSNVALLLTTKFASRTTEVAVRAALGCSRARQTRQFVAEGVLLFVVGGAAGLVLAFGLSDALVVLLPEAIAGQVGFDGIPLDGRLVSFALGLSVLTGLAFGLVAASRTTRSNLNTVIKGQGRSVAGASSRGTLGALVIAEVALAVILLFGAGVTVDAFRRLQTKDLGLDPTGVLTLQVDMTANRYASADARRLFVDRTLDRIGRLPGVVSVALTTVNPLCCGNWGMRMTPEGQPAPTLEQIPIVQHFVVTPGYFATMRQRVVEGRDFSAADVEGAESVVVVDQAFARRFWPGEDALGKRVKAGPIGDGQPWLTIVGLVAPAEEEGDIGESWYLPYAQHPLNRAADRLHFMVRGDESANLIPAIRGLVAEIDPELPLHTIRMMSEIVAEEVQQDRLGAWVSTLFAVAGLLLAALGLYGVLSFVVAGDRVEISVRIALGASRWNVAQLVFGRGFRLVGIGLGAGVAAAWLLAGVLTGLVPEAEPDMRMAFIAVAVLALTALCAMLAPVRRALKSNPIDAIRT
jgi:putative ABC transport system permease protein